MKGWQATAERQAEPLSERDWDFIVNALRERARAMESASRACYKSGTARGTRRVPREPGGLVADYDVVGNLFADLSEQASTLAGRIATAREAGTPIDTAGE